MFSRLLKWIFSRGEKKLCCPRCGRQFCDWFIIPKPKSKEWVRYCYPCSGFSSDAGGAITEEQGVLRIPKENR